MRNLVIGAGVSGYGAAKLLRGKDEYVRVSESSKLAISDKNKYLEIGVEISDGGHSTEHLAEIDRVIPSPGLPPNHPLLMAARTNGLTIISEIDLALAEFRGRIHGVTGTNGKSTTVGMIDHILRKNGMSSAPGGNYGDPPCLMLAENRAPQNLVLELSSYQLEQSNSLQVDSAIFTSFSNDHMARHGSEKDYFAAKWKLLAATKKGAPKVIAAEVAKTASSLGYPLDESFLIVGSSLQRKQISGLNFATISGNEVVFPEGARYHIELNHLQGEHNICNAIFAAAVLYGSSGLGVASSFAKLRDYEGLPFRLQNLGTFGKRAVFNDSKSTNVESTLVALEAMTKGVVLFLGGIGKGESYAPICNHSDKIELAITFGPTGPDITRDIEQKIRVKNFPTLASVFEQIGVIIKESDSDILFSPACASFDEFRNFMHRGDFFSDQIKKAFADTHGKSSN